MSARQAEFAHLIETERNYVTILVNIVKVRRFYRMTLLLIYHAQN